MKQKRLGRQTVVFEAPPRIAAGATIVGDMEGAGPLGGYFDLILEDDTWGEDTWEKAERKMFEQTVRHAARRDRFAFGGRFAQPDYYGKLCGA